MQMKVKNLLLNDLKQARKNLPWKKILPLHPMSDCERIFKIRFKGLFIQKSAYFT